MIFRLISNSFDHDHDDAAASLIINYLIFN